MRRENRLSEHEASTGLAHKNVCCATVWMSEAISLLSLSLLYSEIILP